MTTLRGPGASGCSSTPLVRKLGLRPEHQAAVIDPPQGFLALVGRTPASLLAVAPTDLLPGSAFDYLHLFTRERRALEASLPAMRAALTPAGMIWVSWPKRSARVPTDLTEDVVREAALGCALVDVKVCAVDAVWSGLKLVIPVRLRGHG